MFAYALIGLCAVGAALGFGIYYMAKSITITPLDKRDKDDNK